MELNSFNDNDFQNLDNTVISELVSQLFKHIKSKECYSYISNLLISSLNEYGANFPGDNCNENKVNFFEDINDKEIITSKYKATNSKNEHLGILNDIHSILSNCSELTSNQKLDFCSSQRHFMKLYLKKVLIQINEI